MNPIQLSLADCHHPNDEQEVVAAAAVVVVAAAAAVGDLDWEHFQWLQSVINLEQKIESLN